MKRSTFVKNLIGFYGIAALPMELVKEYQKIYLLQCFVRGFQYYEGPKLIKSINKTGFLELVREPNNKYDKNAIALHFNKQKIGFIPAESNEVLARLLDARLLKVQAEITHIQPKASSWEKIGIAIYALKEINNKEIKSDYSTFGVLETPKYYSLKSKNNTYSRIYFNEFEQVSKQEPIDYYQVLVDNSTNDGVYSLIHDNFPNSEDLEDAFNNSKIVIRKNNKFKNFKQLSETIDDKIVEIENMFDEDGFIVANVDEVAKIPDKIKRFVEITDKKGRIFYELILKAF